MAGPPAKRSKSDRFGPMISWLRKQGAVGLEHLEVRPSTTIGDGLFSKRAITPGGLIASIPQSSVLSVERAVESAHGATCKGVHGDKISGEWVLLLWMVRGREDPTHPFYTYLTSLPEEASATPWWPQDTLELLASSSLGASTKAVQQEFEAAFNQIVPPLLEQHLEAFECASREGLTWAYDMYHSRRYPVKLCSWLEPDAHAGVLLPMLDLLNHKNETAIQWTGTDNGIEFSTAEPEGIPADIEVVNNYGPKSNAMLLLRHGFAIPENRFDTYPLQLTASQDGAKLSLGPFHIRRADEQWAQFPPELWLALSDPVESLARTKSGQACNEQEIEIEGEDVELLLQTLCQRHAAVVESVAAAIGDGGRVEMVRVYLDGQRSVLEEAVETLQEMLGMGAGEEEE
eukprot:TRINITY_DN10859_c0_g1_i3.p1 TRINITY_DN10859_c0_g1~~TRINITY_DN10859_c0_g1_i3.p1  ORF type:complete len:402 (+),score=67.15 TRINITY_DN10859_c0_g1_i3:36-1241(+)